MQTIAVLLTCHNRVNNTMRCLSHLFGQLLSEDFRITVYLVDDGSTDGTAITVKEKYPDINILHADGSLFWNRGMHRAFGEALKSKFDFYLWLNDDTYLYQDAIERLLDTHNDIAMKGHPKSIVVASTRDSITNEFTYGGYQRIGGFINPLRLRLVAPSADNIRCDTMCGNCVLIPKEVARVVGNIDPIYRHRWGDVDYGLRAVKHGFQIWVPPGYLATCDGNPNADRWRDRSLPLKLRIKELNSLKGLGKNDWFRFVRIHGGTLWPIIWLSPYMRLIYS